MTKESIVIVLILRKDKIENEWDRRLLNEWVQLCRQEVDRLITGMVLGCLQTDASGLHLYDGILCCLLTILLGAGQGFPGSTS
jgi:predicted ATPase